VTALPGGIRVILLDIEGTTTRIGFVHETLFGYAREHLDPFLGRRSGEPAVRDIIDLLAVERSRETAEDAPQWREGSPGARIESATLYLRWLMDRDRKSPALKLLQGLIWEEGYQAGELRGEVFDDVPPALKRWTEAGREVAIYSSGSQLAQRRLFASTGRGDLTPFLRAFFDTGVGPKVEAESYNRIADALGIAPDDMTFISDVARELDAASAAGCRVLLCIRPGNPQQSEENRFQAIRSFDELP
jgi:enolase-phosphatase E1